MKVTSQTPQLPVQSSQLKTQPTPQSPQPEIISTGLLGSDKLDIKGIAAGALAGAGTLYLPLVVGGYGLSSPFGGTFKQALIEPFKESWTRNAMGVAAVAGGLAGAYASQHAESKGEGFKQGGRMGALVGAVAGGVAGAVFDREFGIVSGAIGGAFRGAIAGGITGAAGGFAAKAVSGK